MTEWRPALVQAVTSTITTERILAWLRPIADTAGPSQTSSATRGTRIEALLHERGLLDGQMALDANVGGSGCDVLRRGRGGLRILAHLDEISYLVAAGTSASDGWPVVPFCYHLAEGRREAMVVRYKRESGYQELTEGWIDGPPDAVRFHPAASTVDLEPGDRIVLRSPVQVNPASQQVTGSLDNAAGVAAALVAAEVLAALDVPFTLVLTDEEEGPAGASSQTIARGSARLIPHLEPTPLTTVVDIHGLTDEEQRRIDYHQRPWGASLAEYSSRGRGGVTPPPYLHAVRALFDDARRRQVDVTTNVGGHVPRSDDVVATLQAAPVCLLGYPGSNRHFDRGLPTANLLDLVSLARALAVLAVAVDAVRPPDGR